MNIYYIFIIFIFGSLPVLMAIAVLSRNHGSSITLFSPLVVFYVAYMIFGLLRPILYTTYNFSYEFTTIGADQYNLSLIVIAFSNWLLSLGYFFSSYRVVSTKKVKVQSSSHPFLLLLATFFLVSAYLHAFSNDIIGIDISENRISYLSSIQGFGYISLLYIYPGFFLMWYFWIEKKPGRNYLAVILIVLYLLINIMVSNRSVVTIVIYGFLLISQVKKSREERIGIWKIFSVLIGVLLIGVFLGLSRGLHEVDVDLSYSVLFLSFLSATFDMQEMFAHVLSSFSLSNLYYGSTWFQDILYTYLPRAIFSFKPELFGTTLLEHEVLGLHSSAISLATFPLGIYSEGYLNFWYFGVLFSVFVTGYILGFLFTRILKYGTNEPTLYNFWPVFVFLLTSANTLGYLRSFGQYLSAIIFSFTIYLILLMVILLAKNLTKIFNLTQKSVYHND